MRSSLHDAPRALAWHRCRGGPIPSSRLTVIVVGVAALVFAACGGVRPAGGAGASGDPHRPIPDDPTLYELGTPPPRADDATSSDPVLVVATGDRESCVVRQSGALWCWGTPYGLPGTAAPGPTELLEAVRPRRVPAPEPARTVALGSTFGCVILASGRVACWGSDEHGELGDGAPGGPTARPDYVVGLSHATALSLGTRHACALARGEAWCWGSNDAGQLGRAPQAEPVNPRPERVAGLPDGLVSVAAGDAHACAVDASGGTHCWGSNAESALGVADRAPVGPVVVSAPAAVEVAAGAGSTCVRTSAGRVACWGGYVAYGPHESPRIEEPTPTEAWGLDGVTALAMRGTHVCARRADRRLSCWSRDGRGPPPFPDVPYPVSALPEVRAFALGTGHACALLETGDVACFGEAPYGQLGDGFVEDNRRPTEVVGLEDASSIDAGGRTTCAVRRTGEAVCWGRADQAQLGIGSNPHHVATPTPVVGLDHVEQLSVGVIHGCAVRRGGEVWCWGDDQNGQVGQPSYVLAVSPMRVPGLADATRVSSGGSTSCAVRAGGAVWCWGTGVAGARPDARAAPRAIAGVTAVEEIAAGGQTCALEADGDVRCWGNVLDLRPGAGGTLVTSAAPRLVLRAARTLRRGGCASCARTTEGFVCWGGSGGSSCSVPQVFGSGFGRLEGLPEDTEEVVVGEAHACLRRASGAVACWGQNDSGNLGDGTYERRDRPTPVVGIEDARALALGDSHTCVLRASGRVACWGDNSAGQLGNGREGAAPSIVGGPRVVVGLR